MSHSSLSMKMASNVFIAILALTFSTLLVSTDADRIDAIETRLADLADQNFHLQSQVRKLQDDLIQEKTKNARVEDDLRIVKDELSILKTHDLSKAVLKRQLTSPWVAFSAVLQQVDLTNLHSGQTIIFDRVITNMGANYDASTGVFTAPLMGVYVFNMDVMVEPSHNEYLEFVRDGSHVMYNYVHAQGGLDDVSSSRTVVVELNKGDQFWVRITKILNHGSGTVHGNGFTTFSGWLLRILE